MTNLFHDFFYDNENAYCRKNYGPSVWYRGSVFYSYATAIGRIFQTKEGARALVVSYNNFSNTTGRHISQLRAACPFGKIVSVPAIYEGSLDASEILTTIKAILSAERNFNRKEQRETFLNAFYALESLNELKGFKGIPQIIRKYQGIADQLNDKAACRVLSAKIVEKQKKALKAKADKLKKDYKTLTKGLDYLSIVKNAFQYGGEWDYKEKALVKDYLDPSYKHAFCWFDGDKVKTSKGVTVAKTDAVKLLKAWAAGALKHGETIDRYTVLNVGKDAVKIGCHLIPTENLKEMLKEC